MFAFQTNECIHSSYLRIFSPCNIVRCIQQEHSFTNEQPKSLGFGGGDLHLLNASKDIARAVLETSLALGTGLCSQNGNIVFFFLIPFTPVCVQ